MSIGLDHISLASRDELATAGQRAETLGRPGCRTREIVTGSYARRP